MTYKTMAELMAQYRTLAVEEQDWIAAYDILQYAVRCAYLPAKFELARLLRDCPYLGISQNERYAKSELYFRDLMNLLQISSQDTATLAMELAELLGYMKRPVGKLAMLLRAKRNGALVPEREVDDIRQHFMKLDINDFARSTRDALDLATELSLVGGSERMIELLLREASESNNRLIRGRALLALAEFYNDRRENYIYASEAERCYRLAAKAGYPEYLSSRTASMK